MRVVIPTNDEVDIYEGMLGREVEGDEDILPEGEHPGRAEGGDMTEEKRRFRWNFAMGLLHGIFFTGGMAFSNPSAVLPVFLNMITHSKVVIGLFSTIVGSGSVFPQLWIANRIEGKVRKKPVLTAAITVRALCWGTLGLLTYLLGRSHPMTVVVSAFFLLTLFSFMGGVAVVPFMDIWGKAIHPNLRGRFFGHRQLWGGVLAIAAGFVVKRILSDRTLKFPDNYALLFALTIEITSLSFRM